MISIFHPEAFLFDTCLQWIFLTGSPYPIFFHVFVILVGAHIHLPKILQDHSHFQSDMLPPKLVDGIGQYLILNGIPNIGRPIFADS